MGTLSTPGVLRLRATSAVSRDQSVRRSAQDDDFAGVLAKNIPDKLALMGRSPHDPHWLNPRKSRYGQQYHYLRMLARTSTLSKFAWREEQD
jgi:hypothetical protein